MGLCQSCLGQPSCAYGRYRAPLCFGCCGNGRCGNGLEKGNDAKWAEYELCDCCIQNHCYGATLLPCFLVYGCASDQTQLDWSLSELTDSNYYAEAIHAIKEGNSELLLRLVHDSASTDTLGLDDITTSTRRFHQDEGERTQ